MDPEEHVTSSVTGCEVSVIPGSEYVSIRITFVEDPAQTTSAKRKYVFSYGQVAELRDAIEDALRVLKETLKRDPPAPIVH